MTRPFKFLHVSDTHFKAKSDSSHLDALLQYASSHSISLIVHSGDLVDKGCLDALHEFENQLLSNKTNSVQFLVTPGNHDLQREKIPSNIKTANTLLQSSKHSHEIEQKLALGLAEEHHHLSAVLDLINRKTAANFQHSPWYSITEYGHTKFFMINTSIMCGGDDDLIYIPPTVLDEISKQIEQTNFNVAVTHHPTFQFLHSDQLNQITEIETWLSKNVDLLLCGHQHRSTTTTTFSEHGDFVTLMARQFNIEHNELGCYRVEISHENKTIRAQHLFYNHGTRGLVPAADNLDNGYIYPNQQNREFWRALNPPPNISKKSKPSLSVDAYYAKLNDVEQTDVDLLDPELEYHKDKQNSENWTVEKIASKLIESSKLHRLTGPPGSGLTTTAALIAARLSTNEWLNERIVLAINLKNEKSSLTRQRFIQLCKEQSLYDNLTPTEIEAFITNGQCTVFIDGINNESDNSISDKINTIQQLHPEIRQFWITANSNLRNSALKVGKAYWSEVFDCNYSLSALSPNAIANAIDSTFEEKPQAYQELLKTKLFDALKTMYEPPYPSMVKSVLTILSQYPDFQASNRYGLVALNIELLLGRHGLGDVDSEKFNSNDKQRFVAFVASKLLERNQSNFSETDWIQYGLEYTKTYDTEASYLEILNECLKVGILASLDFGYTFRSQTFFCYFVALRMKHSSDFLEWCLHSQNLQTVSEFLIAFVAGEESTGSLQVYESLMAKIERVSEAVFAEIGISEVREVIADLLDLREFSTSGIKGLVDADLLQSYGSRKHDPERSVESASKLIELIYEDLPISPGNSFSGRHAEYLSLLQTFSECIRFSKNLEAQDKRRIFVFLVHHCSNFFALIAQKRDSLANTSTLSDGGITYLNFDRLHFKDNKGVVDFTFMFAAIFRSLSALTISFARNMQLLNSIKRIEPSNILESTFKNLWLIELGSSTSNSLVIDALAIEKIPTVKKTYIDYAMYCSNVYSYDFERSEQYVALMKEMVPTAIKMDRSIGRKLELFSNRISAKSKTLERVLIQGSKK